MQKYNHTESVLASVAAGSATITCVLVLLFPAGTSAGTASQDIAWLNSQRAAHGLPAGVIENAAWSRGCDLHIGYMQRNGVLGHDEDPTRPQYTPEGDQAGNNSVLSWGDTWTADRNPWELAPIHLAQLLAPRLSEMGVADRDGFVCATTWLGYRRPLPVETSVVTYPGNGTAGIYGSMEAHELPFVPGDLVGLPEGTRTGPHLYAYVWGPVMGDSSAAREVSLTAASLVGPEGTLEVHFVDHTTDRIGPYLPPGSAIIIPARPLRGNSTYTASVTFAVTGEPLSHSWSFTTSPLRNTVRLVTSVDALGYVRIHARSDAPATVTATQAADRRVLLSGKHGFFSAGPFTLRSGTWQVCVTSGGPGTEWAPASACRTVRRRATAGRPRPAPPRHHRGSSP